MPMAASQFKWRRTGIRESRYMGLLAVLFLVFGMLNFPSTCDCGAELPHAHSLFILGDHYHSPDGEIDTTPKPHSSDATSSATHADWTPGGPTLQGPSSEFIGGGPIGLSLTTVSTGSGLTSGLSVDFRHSIPSGETTTPEPPPPQRVD